MLAVRACQSLGWIKPWTARLWQEQLSIPVAHSPPGMKDDVSTREMCRMHCCHLSPYPLQEGEGQCGDTHSLGTHGTGLAGDWGWHSRIATQLLLIRFYILSQQANLMPHSVFWEHMYPKSPKIPPTLSCTFCFPRDMRTIELFALMRMCSVRLSQPNSNLSKKCCKDIGSGNTLRNRNKSIPQNSYCNKLPG